MRDSSTTYHAISEEQIFFLALTLILNGLLLLELLSRERSEWANIGFEGVLMLVLYVAAFVLLFLG